MKQPTVYVLAGRGGKPWIPGFAGTTVPSFVMPAGAGIQGFPNFMPHGWR